MLQIISGKFFTTEELYAFDAKSVLFSNYSWIGKIDTAIGSIEPVFSTKDIVTSYIFQYRNRIEKEKCHPLVRTGDPDITDQFRLLCMFWFQAYFNKEKSTVERYCQHSPTSQPFSFYPIFISRFFDRHIHGVHTEVEGFPAFIDKVIGLERKSFEQVICSLHHLFNALELSILNFDLAYSMLVYVLESYSQAFDDFQPTWRDFDPLTRSKLDAVIQEIDKNQAERIRDVLITSSNFKAQQRMLDYVEKTLSTEYFLQQSRGLKIPLRKSELKTALKNAYTLRSNFAHTLQSVQEQLPNVNVGEFDTFHWEGRPYLTFRGLFRLTYGIIKEFISLQPVIEKESYDYYNHLPNVFHFEVDPKYWIWMTENFRENDAIKRFSGLLQELENVIFSDKPVVDMRALLEVIKDLYPQTKKKSPNRPALFSIYYLCNSLVSEELRSPDCINFINYFMGIYDSCSIEAMISQLITGIEWRWDSITCEEMITRYLKEKYTPKSLKIPLLFEMGMITHLANRFLLSGRYTKYKEWLQFVITDLPSQPELQNYVRERLDRCEPVSLFEFIQALVPENSKNT